MIQASANHFTLTPFADFLALVSALNSCGMLHISHGLDRSDQAIRITIDAVHRLDLPMNRNSEPSLGPSGTACRKRAKSTKNQVWAYPAYEASRIASV